MQLFDFIKVVWNGWCTPFITNKWSKSDINPWIIKNSEMTHRGELRLKKSWEPKTDLGLIVNWKCFCFSAISLRKPVRIISSFFPTGYKFLGAWECFFSYVFLFLESSHNSSWYCFYCPNIRILALNCFEWQSLLLLLKRSKSLINCHRVY